LWNNTACALRQPAFTVRDYIALPLVRWAEQGRHLKRYGLILGLKPEAIEEYKRCHVNVWPSVLKIIRDCNIRNYSIFLKDERLFAYYEYIGHDHAADMAKMAADPEMQRWWSIMEPLQQPLESRKPGEWWAAAEEVFHTD
jgi:L-rhamnose mutarotase